MYGNAPIVLVTEPRTNCRELEKAVYLTAGKVMCVIEIVSQHGLAEARKE